MGINWQVIPARTVRGQRKSPFISVGRGSIDISAAACDLLPKNYKDYTFALLLKAGSLVGIRLLAHVGTSAPDENAIPTSFKRSDSKDVKGITITNKAMVEEMFGTAIGLRDKATRFPVRFEDDCFVVDLKKADLSK